MSTQRAKSSRQDLRVLKKNMIYCSGIPSSLTEKDLKSHEYFGQFGDIDKMVVSPFPNRNYCSIYITFAHQFEAATAILACNEFQIERSILWCLFGTMKYCTFFMKKIECKNLPNCPYLHNIDKKNEIQIKNSPSQAFPLHIKLAKQVINKFPSKLKKLKGLKTTNGKLPSPLKVFQQISEILEENQEISQVQKPIQKQIQGSVKKEEQIEVDLEGMIKAMIITQIRKSRGSRIIKEAKDEQKILRQVILLQLKK